VTNRNALKLAFENDGRIFAAEKLVVLSHSLAWSMKLYKDPMATPSIAGVCLEHNELCKGSYQCLLQKEECRHGWQTIRAQNVPEGYFHAYH
jgi:hypothetical protein